MIKFVVITVLALTLVLPASEVLAGDMVIPLWRTPYGDAWIRCQDDEQYTRKMGLGPYQGRSYPNHWACAMRTDVRGFTGVLVLGGRTFLVNDASRLEIENEYRTETGRFR